MSLLKALLAFAFALGIVSASAPTLSGYGNETDLSSATVTQTGSPAGFAPYMHLYWTIDTKKMLGGIVCKLGTSTDWCGWGISPSSNAMIGSDAVIFWNDGTNGYGQQYTLASKSMGSALSCPESVSTGLKVCPTYEASSQCCNNVELVRADVVVDGSDVYLVGEWKRNLQNSDSSTQYCSSASSQITSGDTKYHIWGVGPVNAGLSWPYNLKKHYVRSSGTNTITFVESDSGTTAANPTCHTPTSGGDPHFGGLKGQKYDVMGQSYEIYNIITSPHLQINSRFIPYYKALGQIVPTGTMIGELGIKFNAHKLYINPNTTTVVIDKQEYSLREDWTLPFEDDIVVSNSVNGRNYDITLQTEELTIVFIRKAYLITGFEPQYHFDYKIPRFQEKEMHGLLGQTWEVKSFSNKQGAFKYLDGFEEDYRIKSNNLFGDDFTFNKFQNV